MPLLNVFLLIGLFALVFSFFQKKSAIWGAATLGLIVGILWGIFSGDFTNIIRYILIGASVGLVFEIIGIILDLLKHHHS